MALGAGVVGAAVRLEQYGWRRSLWLDEALIAGNIVQRSFGGLLRPLSGGQGAPVGWLWGERAAVVVGGNNEYALRLIPLVAGVIALPLVWVVARSLVGRWGAALAVGLLAFAPAAIRYSVEVKQYASDLCIALLLTALALAAGRTGRAHNRRALAAWGLVGAVAVWCSHPAVLVLAGTAVALTIPAAAQRDVPRLRSIVGWSLPWAASFALDWLVSLRRLGQNTFLHTYWSSGFAPGGVGPLARWLVRAPVRLVSDPAALPVAAASAAVILFGLGWIMAHRPAAGAVLALPLAAGLGAAAVGAYPLEGRMALWLLPVAVLGLAAAAEGLAAGWAGAADRWFPPHRGAHRAPRSRWGPGLLAALCAVPLVQAPVRQAAAVAHDPATWVDLRPLLQAVQPRRVGGDLVWIHTDDAPSAAYYARSTGVSATSVVWDGSSLQNCPGSTDLRAAAHGGRVWFVFGYVNSSSVPNAEAALDARLAALAHLVTRIVRPHASATLWDFGAAPDTLVAGAAGGRVACVSVTPSPPPPATGLTTGPLGRGRRV